MRFILTYDGKLPTATRNKSAEKMAIREQLHPQLLELWNHEPLSNMQNLVEPSGMHLKSLNGHGFAVVVHDYFNLRAELDVLMLRNESPGRIIVNSDIDNGLKILFDALTWPVHADQVPSNWTPQAGQTPLHCLLADDRYITRVGVETERWLAAPSPDHVRLIIRVNVWARGPSWGTIKLGL